MNEIISKDKVNGLINERENRKVIDEHYYPNPHFNHSVILQHLHKNQIFEKLSVWNRINPKNQISNYNPENLKAQFNGQSGFLDINTDGYLEFKDEFYRTIKIFNYL